MADPAWAAAWRRNGVQTLAMVAAGALQTLAFTHTAMWWLPILGAALLALAVTRSTPRRAAWLGWCYGTAWVAAGTWWLFISMHRYGGLPAPLAAAAVLALAAALSLYLALACAAVARWRSGSIWADAALFAACWLLAELARGVIFTGFPWLASGYSQLDGPLAWLAPWVGVYGIGALLAFMAALLALARPLFRPSWPAGVAVLWMLPALLPGAAFTQSAGTLRVSLLQTNVAQDEKFRLDRMPEAIERAVAELAASQADLVVGPETVIPLLPHQLAQYAPGGWEALQQRFSGGPQAALIGVPLGSYEEGYTNSVVGLSAAAPYRYDKAHLVPFGEFIPPAFRWFTEMMNIPLGDFNRGAKVQPSFGFKGQRLAPNICYEDLFGEELALRFADAASAPTIFVNISNIGWFGDTVALPQHLAISRMRSLEFQRPMLRATNTGATAIIDHRGVVQAQLPAFVRQRLDGSVEGRSGATPFAVWAAHLGLWPLLLLAITVVTMCRAKSRR